MLHWKWWQWSQTVPCLLQHAIGTKHVHWKWWQWSQTVPCLLQHAIGTKHAALEVVAMVPDCTLLAAACYRHHTRCTGSGGNGPRLYLACCSMLYAPHKLHWKWWQWSQTVPCLLQHAIGTTHAALEVVAMVPDCTLLAAACYMHHTRCTGSGGNGPRLYLACCSML